MGMRVGNRRALLAGVRPIALTYQFQDRFLTDAAAPLTTPRNAEPGPGALTIVDTNNIMSVSGGALLFNGTNAVSDRLAPSATLARLAGRCMLFNWADVTSQGSTGGSMRLGWDTTVNSAGLTYGYDFGANVYRIKSGASVIDSVTPTTIGWFGLLMRGTGGIALHRIGNSGRFQVDWVYALSNAALFHKAFLNTAEARNCKLDNWLVVDFPAPLTTDAAIATTLTASPTSGASGQMTSDGLVEFTWTPAAAETLELDVRRVDANNRWIIRCSQAGSTIKLIEMNNGVEAERASNSQTWTAATTYRILVVADTQNIKNWAGLASTDALTAKNVYAAASFQQNATGVAVAGFATGANLIAFPRYLTLPGI